jgi:hypothetical protein
MSELLAESKIPVTDRLPDLPPPPVTFSSSI